MIALLVATASAQWAGVIQYSGNSCSDDSKITLYQSAKVESNGCTPKIPGSNSTQKVDCGNPLSGSVCDANCANCQAGAPASLTTGCTQSGNCITCTFGSVTVSSTQKCFGQSSPMGWTKKTFQIRTYSNTDCTGPLQFVSGFNADGLTCVSAGLGSIKYSCDEPKDGQSNGKMESFSSADCSGTAVSTTLVNSTTACVAGTRMQCGVGAGSALTVSFAVLALAAVFAFLF